MTKGQWQGNSVQYLGQTVTTAFWFYFFWYGGWALLWSYQQLSTPPHFGWWDWALPIAAIFTVLERLSVDLETKDTAAKARGFWGPYQRQAAIGIIFGLGLLVTGVAAGLMQWSRSPFDDATLGIL